MRKYTLLALLIIAITSCDKSVKPIKYGEDQCDYCSMSIVQKTHSAQMVTEKGKQHKFDAVECMVNYIKQEPKKFENATLLVANYNQPGEMIPAENSAYLISKSLPSPMGANLTAFATTAEAKEAQKKLDGKVYQWNELMEVINTNSHQSR
ncbi:nitrous oxide reductase accessory protein NosL [Psychroflexus sp. CAK57W]|uniref:nitrous oxide reductase accessory protein NosL n=1 Tax=Psychroflexus curvus TaxID=2873595 RepID=UPI001CCE9FE7|nr:nitrous oxide reductase accessory protein NosL [Psychroflexus curvus]MBZ9627877.1 nitrous oxide reductase accessory protein NosL [Psychroflexus curvus]MBZ9787554.1 nitrous oxide reductase accessory protein NosL [Psychroflexus curvus]